MTEKNSVLFAEITDYPKFSLTPIGKDKFESKEAGVILSLTKLKMVLIWLSVQSETGF